MGRRSTPPWLTGSWLPWVAGLLGVLIFHRLTILSGFDWVQADLGDSRYIASVLEHWNQVAHGRAQLLSPPVFFPVRGTLGYSDALAAMGAVHIGLRALGLGVFTALNVQEVALSALAFAAAYGFLRRGFALGRFESTAGAWLFAFSWPRFAALQHVQLLTGWTLPCMALLALECLRDGRALGRAGFAARTLGFVLLFFATLATAVYLAEFTLLLLGVTVGLSLLARAGRRQVAAVIVRQWPGLAAGAVLAALLTVPILRIYGPVMRASGGWSWLTVASQLLDPADYVWMGLENLVWGWLFARWPLASIAHWPEKRLGFGAVVTLAWLAALVWAALRLRRGRGQDGDLAALARRDETIAALAILSAALVQVSVLRIGGRSLWWLVFTALPGAGAIRSAGRIELAASLPMALGVAMLLRQALRPPATAWRRVAVAALAAAAALEQVGTVQSYSGRDAEAAAARIAAAIPRECRAAFVVSAHPEPPPPIVTDERRFDAAAYLAANPDVAANWRGSAWQHYVQFGRQEHRSLDPAVFDRVRMRALYYAYTVPLAASLAGVPVVNGLSGWRPPGWDLDDAASGENGPRLAAWLARFGLDPAAVCIVPITLTPQSIRYRPRFDPWWLNWTP